MDDERVTITEDQSDPENIKTQRAKPVNFAPEEFYGQFDSIYVRVKWDNVVQGFSMSVRNELVQSFAEPQEIPEEIVRLSSFIRGMIELGMAFPSKCYSLGLEAQNADYIRNSEGLTEAQKELLQGEPQGSA
jgi:hypothetical protein